LALVRKSNLPRPEVNAKLGPWEVDFLWRRERLAVEIDGYAFHSSRPALERDHRKDADLQNRGLLVLRYSPRLLRNARESVLAEVAGTLARRA
jgi:very-short-patch-repair endonuclease